MSKQPSNKIWPVKASNMIDRNLRDDVREICASGAGERGIPIEFFVNFAVGCFLRELDAANDGDLAGKRYDMRVFAEMAGLYATEAERNSSPNSTYHKRALEMLKNPPPTKYQPPVLK